MMTLTGIILKAQSGFFTVHTEQGAFVCHLRGRLKQTRQSSDLATIGDEVTIAVQPDGKGMIESIAPRRTALLRRAPTGHGRTGKRAKESEAAQVIIANPDQAVFVFSCAEPAPRLRALDRFLVMAEAEKLPALVCANKVDLIGRVEAEKLFNLYPPLGYPVLYTSAKTSEGLEELKNCLHGKLSVMAGPSGVGKSSLLNTIQPGLGLRSQAISRATQKGKHTTVHPELWPLEGGGYLADTPGMRALSLWDVEPEELDAYFVEIRPLVAECEFNDCSHLNEPGCAVRAAVAAGKISVSRYDSYCRIRVGEN